MSDTEPPILTVSQLTNAIKMCLEGTFPLIWLQGEVSNCKLQSSGHLYFSLKDSKAQIAAVMFRGDMSGIKFAPKDGDNVIVRGELNVYPPNGKYQLLVREMRHAGLGELLIKLEQLKIKLHQKGYFKQEHKKPLPKFPKRIGVVTSPTGAVIQDILNVLSRRFSGFHLILNPVKVQGEGAAQEIAQAIQQFNQHDLVDVIIAGRGGGSLEDLWAFNEEIVADAIFNSRIPIISAVGHETDHSIADYVADVRAPTPSAAAEIVIAEKAQQLAHLQQLHQRFSHSVSQMLRQDKQRLNSLVKHPVFISPYRLLGPWMQKLDASAQQLQALKPSTQILHFRQKFQQYERALGATMQSKCAQTEKLLSQKIDRLHQSWRASFESRKRNFQAQQKHNQLDQSAQRLLSFQKNRLIQMKTALDAINPKNLLSKGYCILFAEKDRSVVTSVSSVKKQDVLQVILADGELITTVKEVVKK